MTPRKPRTPLAPASSPAQRPRRFSRAIAALGVCLSAGAFTAHMVSGCQQSPQVVAVRSLQQSGKASFVCLAPNEPFERPLAECTAQQFSSICQYEYEYDGGTVDADVVRDDAGVPVATYYPHLYALVTQTATGEVAVVDTSVYNTGGGVLDEDPIEPGANFLHVGDQPRGIVSTPGSVATFVATAEVGRAGIYAIPSSQIRPATAFGVPDTCAGNNDGGVLDVPQLSTWPACALPAAPGDMLLIYDPPNSAGLERASCDTQYSINPLEPDPKNVISYKEGQAGRAKLVVAFPDYNGEGGIAIFDAESIFDQPAGSFDACKPERWVPLKINLAGLAGQPAAPTGLACANPQQNTPPLAPNCGSNAGASAGPPTCYRAQPSGLSYADGKLYVADTGAPEIHVIDMHDTLGNPTPCNPVEQAPLLPTSAEQPQRVVFAGKVTAASQLTPDFKRYLYATDVEDASAMIFDIGPDSTTRRPLTRAHPEWDPFHPRDRVKFTAPPADIIIVQRDAANIDPVTGLAPAGVECNPDPNAISCTANSHNCDPGVAYQPASDYSTGAGPLKLRGEFAFAALTNGHVAVIDIADFDAPCRAPAASSELAGCDTTAKTAPIPTGTPVCGAPPFQKTTYEQTCGVVSRGEARAALFEAAGTFAGNHVPGVLTYPLLYQTDGSVFSAGSGAPQMVATLPQSADIPAACNKALCNTTTCANGTDTADPLPGCPLELMIGGNLQPIDTASGGYATCVSASNQAPVPDPTLTGTSALLMNLEDPRAHIADQNWTVTFEGALPGFNGRLAALISTGPGTFTLTDPNSRFCDFGVLSKKAFTDQLSANGMSPGGVPAPKGKLGQPSDADYADYVQISSDIPAATDPYWNGPSIACNPAATYGNCFAAFGSIQQVELSIARDLRIVEAYEDHVELELRNPVSLQAADGGVGIEEGTILSCCFPTAVTFNVRPGNQWAVVGDQSQFLHHVVADQTSGVCRNNCDGNFDRLNGRLTSTLYSGKKAPVVNDRAVGAYDPGPSFMNPMFRFGIVQLFTACDATQRDACSGETGVSSSAVVSCVAGGCNAGRDTVFKFSTNQSFSPMLVSLATDSSLIEPTSITYLAPTQEVAITDGSLNGLIMVSLQTGAFSRSFF